MVALGRKFVVVADATALAFAAADRVMARIADNPGRIAICLTGGSSPRRLYELLGQEPYQGRIPWDRVHWFIGDDRFVKPGNPLHNMSMARGIFLDRCAPAANIHPIDTEAHSPYEAARLYEEELQRFYGALEFDPPQPLFDLVLLGVGPDGHIASLFPSYPAVEVTDQWVVGVSEAHVEPFVPRVSLTLPTLGSCREMLFEVGGADKRAIMSRVLEGTDLPANRARSYQGETVWLCDRDAMPEDHRG
ncbi:6-phosphogluconolactonase [Tardiphaga sp.]|uniref:6-phosphogluconolactonase n=1 Tax=Tardiphaga sp. TaxID=1926292 RepID=UPI00262FB504|nr:6-phosphogluconolactonase [Tardiphaga sp.]MDB5618299.1 6-phosphogluconolactonase [Tardiphaga sp.]